MDIRLKDIEPNEYYSARHAFELGIFPWNNAMTFYERLERPSIKEVLKPIVEMNKHKKSYKLKGSNIIKFITLLEEGNIEL